MTARSHSRRNGPASRFSMGGHEMAAVLHPDEIAQVLVHDFDRFRKPEDAGGVDALSDGLLLSDGDRWQHQRRRLQPMFYRERIETHAETMGVCAATAAEEWAAADGSVDLAEVTSRSTSDRRSVPRPPSAQGSIDAHRVTPSETDRPTGNRKDTRSLWNGPGRPGYSVSFSGITTSASTVIHSLVGSSTDSGKTVIRRGFTASSRRCCRSNVGGLSSGPSSRSSGVGVFMLASGNARCSRRVIPPDVVP